MNTILHNGVSYINMLSSVFGEIICMEKENEQYIVAITKQGYIGKKKK